MGAFARGTRFGRAAGRILDDDPFHDDPLDDDPLDTPQTTSAENEGTPHT
ncbi:hypothetical protein [Streptomyces ipomoeae]|nr:hypothetical protein [Streptomyces ipomoeae]MDX2842097.1 hypothetical protein [Streptomyces ipomoeae]MDX2876539.1 hypothetical protein [Streptomyces ipomoeae]